MNYLLPALKVSARFAFCAALSDCHVTALRPAASCTLRYCAAPALTHRGNFDTAASPEMGRMSHASMPMAMDAGASEMAAGGAPPPPAHPQVASMAAPARASKMKAQGDISPGGEAWRSAPKVDAVAPPASRLLVKNGNVQLEVPRDQEGGIPAVMQTIEAKAHALQGMVERASTYSNDGEEHTWRQGVQGGSLPANAQRPPRSVQTGSVSVRVPAQHFEEFMTQLASLGVPVLSSSHNVQDVTDQYVDTVARVNTQQAALKQLEEIMKQATRVQDMTTVQNRMMAVVEALERHKATQLRLEKQAAMSTVHVNLNLQAAAPQPPRPRDVPVWSPSNSVHRAFNTLLVAAQGVVDSIILLLLVGIPMAAVAVVCLFAAVQGASKALSYFAGDVGSAMAAVRSAADDVAHASVGSGGRAGSPAGARQRSTVASRID